MKLFSVSIILFKFVDFQRGRWRQDHFVSFTHGTWMDWNVLGISLEGDEGLVISNPSKTLREITIVAWNLISSSNYPKM
jgi:hypothetical protein